MISNVCVKFQENIINGTSFFRENVILNFPNN